MTGWRRFGIRPFAATLLVPLSLAACHRQTADVVPPRANDPVPAPQESSVIAVPVEADASAIRKALEEALPRQLWTINQHSGRCVAPQRVKLLGVQLKVTPPISCTIVGAVTRGPITLRGEGREIVADVPLTAQISARDVGGILKGETATGSAMARARITIDIRPDWSPVGTVRLAYDWTKAPGIDFLGQRITFTDQADAKLRPVIRRLEQTLPHQLARMDLRGQVDRLWRQGFTTLPLNDHNPPVWMRVTPRRLLYNGYAMQGNRLRLNLGMEAMTETFVGDRPANPAPTSLPPAGRGEAKGGLRFFIPVTADYAQLEPVILRALKKRAARPFVLPGIGPVMARFEKVVAYGTTNGRIAVGITLAARPASSASETHGQIWVSATPVNAPNSPRVRFDQLSVTGDTDGMGGDLLLTLGSTPGFAPLIADSLTQNFAKDLDKLLGKVRRAIAEKREGAFLIQSDLATAQIGQLRAYGRGLYLPVRATGSARIAYRPTR